MWILYIINWLDRDGKYGCRVKYSHILWYGYHLGTFKLKGEQWSSLLDNYCKISKNLKYIGIYIFFIHEKISEISLFLFLIVYYKHRFKYFKRTFFCILERKYIFDKNINYIFSIHKYKFYSLYILAFHRNIYSLWQKN